ncbi:class II aldolase/adducin family protein [Glaciecola sp. XM2]|jgi:ribulose-5-phosphate 4-epimerase/fuculose-1-phosphate aldolase|uniref:class II aldolase/adducin family protein n=1 Tax=Glaciecola sp. XM2 TaxID=1914931 RepID=UPI001BDF2876|nr:class II aldolase/adducin family protein [Glaciecola sp. XM2]MBT1450974.1 class II aldolase/adducin family protein [Glaciecola sp. XM2]
MSVKEQVSEQEWQARVDLAACYRMVAHYGWDDLVFTHISARVPGPEHHFLINPYGMLFEEVTASSLVKVDLAGNKVSDSEFDVNPAGFVIHSAVHEARDNAQCVMHLHTTAGVAISALEAGLQPYSQQSLFALSSLSYHNYEGVALNPDEKVRLVADLGDTNFMILRNHGLLTCAETIPDTFLLMFILQRACEIQLQAQATQQPLIPIDSRILAGIKAQAKEVTRSAGGALAWPGILRKLDRLCPDFRD